MYSSKLIPSLVKSILILATFPHFSAKDTNILDPVVRLNDYFDNENNCDIQVIYDHMTSENYGTCTRPVTIFRSFFHPRRSRNWVQATGNSVTSRVGVCKISLLFPSFFKGISGDNIKLQKWFAIA